MPRSKPRRTNLDDDSPLLDDVSLDKEQAAIPKPNFTISLLWRWILSVFAVLHVASIYAEPLRFSSQNASPVVAPHAAILRRWTAPYADLMYLNHGYFFFAPNPGPSHLVVCRFNDLPASESDSSSPSASSDGKIVIPDKGLQKPRLLFHRYFMYAEFYQTLFLPADLPEIKEADPLLLADIRRGKRLYSEVQDSFRRFIDARYPNRRYQVYRVEHQLPTPEDYFNNHWRLDDPRLYFEMPESAIISEEPSFQPVEIPPAISERPNVDIDSRTKAQQP